MIDRLISILFRWGKLRLAIFDEVRMHDQIDEAMKDITIVSLHWYEPDGWRSWVFDEDRNVYIFNDIPFAMISESFIDTIKRGTERCYP